MKYTKEDIEKFEMTIEGSGRIVKKVIDDYPIVIHMLRWVNEFDKKPDIVAHVGVLTTLGIEHFLSKSFTDLDLDQAMEQTLALVAEEIRLTRLENETMRKIVNAATDAINMLVMPPGDDQKPN